MVGFQMSLPSDILCTKRWKLGVFARRPSCPAWHESLWEKNPHLRSPIRNEVEPSDKKICAQCSTLWPSAQYLCSIIQPNYQELNRARAASKASYCVRGCNERWRGIVLARVQCGRSGQTSQSRRRNFTEILVVPWLSTCGVQVLETFPWGQSTCSCSQSILNCSIL